ncbi:MAG: hypothetical protein COA70_11280 [Planctomycetota bacterium]|nr:MAG: hypothetical protein COA70_11280 [Planctomycetota bacterium]
MIAFLLVIAQVATPSLEIAPATGEALAQAKTVIAKGVGFLIETQNADGSWGGSRKPMIYDRFWTFPETHRSWQIATTGLAVMTLMDLPDDANARAAVDHGIDYITNGARLKRPTGWDSDNTWGYIYGFAALVKAAQDERLGAGSRKIAIEAKGKELMQQMWDYQAPNGGWAYYAMETEAARPSWGTSFMTGVAVLAILDAKQLGWEIEEKRLRAGIRAIEHCRLPDGSYTYSVNPISVWSAGTGIDRVRGSLSRIQVCNLALARANDAGYETSVTTADLKEGLALLFREHHYLDIARGRPRPHEAYHYNSGYFYYFGHYYAGYVLERLGPSAWDQFLPPLVHSIAKTQSPDGAMIDFFMNDYGRPYGVAYGVGALMRATTSAP